MRIARIARPGALYDASVSSQTFETIGEMAINPIDFDEAADVNVAKLIGSNYYSNITGFWDINRKSPNNANRVNFLKRNKYVDKAKTHFRRVIYSIYKKRLRN